MKSNKKLNWTCGIDEMPSNFDRYYLLRYVYKLNNTSGAHFGSLSTISKLDKIDKFGYKFDSYGAVKTSQKDNSIIELIKNDDYTGGGCSTIKKEMFKYLYWAELEHNSDAQEKVESIQHEKKRLEEKLAQMNKLLEKAIKESRIEHVDESEFEEINKDLKEKFENLVEKTKVENKNKPSYFKYKGEFKKI